MANTDEKKPQAKPRGKKPARKKAAVKASQQAASQPAPRKTAAAKAPPVKPAPAPAPKPAVAETPPVLINAVKPEEKLAETGLVESAVDSLEKSLKAAMPAAVAVNSKLVDIAQANMNSGMALARDLAGARTPMEFMRLGMTYWQENMGLFQAQAEELRTLSAKFVTTASEPIRDHIRRA
jgi:hypothetical protein